MITLPDRREFWLYMALVLASTTIFMAGSVVVSKIAINQILAKEAGEQADSFRSYLIASTEALDGFLAGTPPATRTMSFLANTPRVGALYRYRLFGSDGKERFTSDELDFGTVSKNVLELPNGLDARQMKPSEPLIQTRLGGQQDFLDAVSIVYLPVIIGDKHAGTLMTYIDQTDTHIHHASQIRAVCIKIGGLSAFAFAFPLAAMFWQVRMRRKADERVAYLARFDALTGLINRPEFINRFEGLLAEGRSFAVHIVDLDKFKEVNDYRGHGIGDLLLIEVGKRISAAAGKHADIARLGGDEFAILHRLSGEGAHDPLVVAAQIVETLGQPFYLDGHNVQIGGSVGTALSGRDGTTREALLRAADTALYVAKNGGRSQAVAFVPAMDEARLARLALEERLRDAIVTNAFRLNFQPIVETGSGCLDGFEALLRLDWPDGKPIPPMEFISVAEDMGVIESIGRWTLREACRIAKDWPPHLKVSVNVSALQFRNSTLLKDIIATVSETGLQRHQLCLELTEGILLEDTHHVVSQLQAIRAEGIIVALDDFGTGYSSLSYLSRLPLDKLKIDKSLTRDLDVPSSKPYAILKTMISLGHVLNMRITVEGVETDKQRRLLQDLGCDHCQGYLLGRPMPTEDLAAVIAQDLLHRTKGQAQRSADPELEFDEGRIARVVRS